MEMDIFLHIALMNNWDEIVAELFDHLSNRIVHVGLVGDFCPENQAILDRISHEKNVDCRIVAKDEPLEHFEIPTLEAAQNSNSDMVVYLHTKGASNPSRYNDNWRRYMSKCLLGDLESNKRKLMESDSNCLGSLGFIDKNQLYRDRNRLVTYFAGNFWMAKTDYLKTLPNIRDYWNLYKRSRYVAELWIGRGVAFDPIYLDGDFFRSLTKLAYRLQVLEEQA